MITTETIAYALLGGIVPALIWLDFLLQEDKRCPEPRWIIALGFFAGMLAALLSLPLEHMTKLIAPAGVATLLVWAIIEETLKYALAAWLVLWRTEVRRPTHLVMSMVTVALGFAALENALFLLEPLSRGAFVDTFVTGNLRFIGATLLHVVASACVGFALAFSVSRAKWQRTLFTLVGVILAIVLHTLFNVFILKGDGSSTLLAFFTVWAGVILFFAAFEVLKYFRYRTLPTNKC